MKLPWLVRTICGSHKVGLEPTTLGAVENGMATAYINKPTVQLFAIAISSCYTFSSHFPKPLIQIVQKTREEMLHDL